jgi:SGNH hydrolase-like domain, acetyltransferase AlgX
MSMKVVVFSIVPIAIWIAALVGMPRANLASTMTEHRLFSSQLGKINSQGFSQNLVNTKLIQSSYLLKAVGDFGYQVRFAFGMYPTWLEIVSDPFNSERMHIIVREEVDVEFTNHLIQESLRQSEAKIVARVKSFAEAKSIEPMVFMVPTKISANRLKVQPEQSLGRDRERYQLYSGKASWVGGLANLSESERQLRAAGVKTLSGVEAVRSLQGEASPVYPYGESHWSPEMILKLAPLMIQQIVNLHPELERCVDRTLKFEKAEELSKKYYGDLLTSSLGWSVDLDISQFFRNEYATYKPVQSKAAIDTTCPELFYVGSSYGTFSVFDLNYVGVLANYYRGKVTNKSVAGQGPMEPLAIVERLDIPKSSLVVWEFTYRTLNDQ